MPYEPISQTQFRFSSELDMRSKKDLSGKEDRSQHPPSSDCFHGKEILFKLALIGYNLDIVGRI